MIKICPHLLQPNQVLRENLQTFMVESIQHIFFIFWGTSIFRAVNISIVKLRERKGQRVDSGRSLIGHL